MSGEDAMPPLVLLAGGLATRLHPLTKTWPKSMLEVAGEPFIAHQLRLLRRQNICDIVICAGFMADAIESYVGTGERFGVRIHYSLDGQSLLGTGGAIKKALPLLGKVFFVMYGDSYLPIDFRPVHEAFHQAVTMRGLMTVYRNEKGSDKSNVIFRDGKILEYNKRHADPQMEHIDYGLGMFAAEAFASWKVGAAFDLAEVYESLLAQNHLAGYEVSQRYYEIGSLQGLQETASLLATTKDG